MNDKLSVYFIICYVEIHLKTEFVSTWFIEVSNQFMHYKIKRLFQRFLAVGGRWKPLE